MAAVVAVAAVGVFIKNARATKKETPKKTARTGAEKAMVDLKAAFGNKEAKASQKEAKSAAAAGGGA